MTDNQRVAEIEARLECEEDTRGNYQSRSDIRYLLSALKEAQGEPKWISVEERLPKEERWCIVLRGKNGVSSAVYIDDSIRNCVFYSGRTKLLGYLDVTHWMPLPPAPKGDNEG
ncbi:MAG: DUF551 domain-containing protein [Bacteroidetes bacterium]|nr:DUF551 domain-containing protein [Bacteroidota bacterium]